MLYIKSIFFLLFFYYSFLFRTFWIKYKITKDKEGIELKEFGNTHIKDNMIYIPQIEAYIDLKKI